MHENETINDFEEMQDSVSDNSGISELVSSDLGSGLSAGTSEIFQPDTGSDYAGYNSVSTGDSKDMVYPYDSSVSYGDAGYSVEVPYLVEISEGIKELNTVVMLLFLFLLFAWTEKKISHAVHNFADK